MPTVSNPKVVIDTKETTCKLTQRLIPIAPPPVYIMFCKCCLLQLVEECLESLELILEEFFSLYCSFRGCILASTFTEDFGDVGRATTIPSEDLLFH